mgnify:CR=1 FL=1
MNSELVENEKKVYKNVLIEFDDKTIIATLHRLHLLPLFDTIYMMDKGRIIASGSYATLKKHPKLAKMIEKSKT